MHGNPPAKTKSLMLEIYSQRKIALIDAHAIIDAKTEKNA
jgi:hypothetical protein